MATNQSSAGPTFTQLATSSQKKGTIADKPSFQSSEPTFAELASGANQQVSSSPLPTTTPTTTSSGRKRRSGRSSSRSQPTFQELAEEPTPVVQTPKASLITRAPDLQSRASPSFVDLAPEVKQQKEQITRFQAGRKRAFTSESSLAPSFLLGKLTGSKDIQQAVEQERQKITKERGTTIKQQTAFLGGQLATQAETGAFAASVALFGTGATAGRAAVASKVPSIFGKTAANIGIGLGEGLLESAAIRQFAQSQSKKTLTAKQKAFIESQKGQAALKSGFQAQQTQAGKEGVIPSIFEGISVFGGKQAAFVSGAEQSLNRKLTKAEQEALKAQRKAIGAGEIATFVNIGRISEGIGSTQFSILTPKPQTVQKGAKAFGSFFAKGFGAVAPAGAVEGALSVSEQQKARKQEVSALQVGTGAALGAASAGVLGGAIFGSAAAGGKVTSKGLTAFANIADPFEKAGDVAQEFVESGLKLPSTKVITGPTSTTLFTSTPTSSKTKTKTPSKQKQTRAFQNNIFAQSPSKQSSVKDELKIRLRTRNLSPAFPSSPFTPNFTPAATPQQPSNLFSPSDVFSTEEGSGRTDIPPPRDPTPDSSSNIFASTQTQTDTTVPASVPASVVTKTPVLVPFGAIQPPVPLSFGLNGGRGRAGGTGRRAFRNELARALGSFGAPSLIKSDFGTKQQISRSRSRSKQSKPIVNVGIIGFGSSQQAGLSRKPQTKRGRSRSRRII